jgi:hypothetical protein
MFFISFCLHAQSLDVRGVTLNYNESKKSLTLNIPKSLVKVKGEKEKIEISISESFHLSINEKPANSFFEYSGFENQTTKIFSVERPRNTKILEENFIYEFQDIASGEYVLQVNNTINDKRLNIQTGSFIIE